MSRAADNERPSTSSTVSTPQFSRADSSPTAPNPSTHNLRPATATATVAKPATPTLSQLGKQGAVNFRLSQLSDSGAESCDADEQARLIRTPSARSRKFIIIPATPPATVPSPPFRQTISTSSLSALAAALQKTPAASPLSTPQPQHHQTQRQRQQAARQLSTSSATVAVVSPTSPTPSQQHNLSDATPLPSATASAAMQSSSSSPPPPIPQSDVVHQQPNAASTGPAASATGVTFTIEDCESDNAAELAALDATYSADSAISSIKSAAKFTPASATPPPAASIGTNAPLLSVRAAPYRTTLTASETTPALGTGLRPSSQRGSMRSVVSAFLPDPHDLVNDPQYNFAQQQQQYLHPTSSGRELSSSSYIYRDHIANQIYSDVTSVRSLASIGIGSTDGRRLVIRRVPHTPDELFSLVHPPSPPPPGIDDGDDDSFMDPDETANLKPRQQHWANKMQFVLACIGYSVGLGNVWRFPYMCYKSGGGVFLVPYCIILFICSIPLLFMELSVGQYTGRGPIGALGQLCPLFKGAGLASVVVSFLMSTYYSVIIGYSIYYFFTSFRTNLPWIDCKNRWNTPDCWVPQRVDLNMTAPSTSRTPSEEFFENKVLQISNGIEYPGVMRWELFVCLICAWLLVYFATWKSIKSSAKVRYFTATFPFVLIIILMVHAVTLEGADAGLRYFFRPNWAELKSANVWINAASQNFNSLGVSFGSMISFASYNKYNNNVLRDAVAVSIVNMLTSLLVGVFAFATLGNLALEQNTNVGNVINDGPGLIFVVYPQAMAKMPYAQLWAVMFFFMLLCLGLNTQFAIVEVVVTSIQDGFPNWIKRHLGYHEIVVLFVCVISFLFGLPNLIQGGIYFFQLIDHYTASISIMFLAFCQMVAVAWFYGIGRLSKNIKQMTGKAPSLYIKSCWILLGPCLLFAIWVLSMVNYQEPTYHNGRYKYPDWAYGIGWMFASFSLVCIPGYAIINLLRSSGNTFWERISNTLRPNIYECRICGEHHCEHDFPEQEQYMLAQELSAMYKPHNHMQPSSPMQLNMGVKATYKPMYLQQQEQTEFTYEEHQQQQRDAQSPQPAATTSAAATVMNSTPH